ncbi:MAG: gliding motility-associated C-terminal domain-containing protein [Flavobacterium sp.]|nr:gliding motility-associated C-terminal domain-containing protein [Flavobacterium sp.]
MKLNSIQVRFLSVLLLCYTSGNSQTKTNNEGLLSNIGIAGSLSEINNLATGTITNDGDLYVYNHYNNNGTVTFTAGSNGMTRMKGLLGSQNISGSTIMQWYNCEFDNSIVQPAFHLSNQLSIAGNADFFQGIVDDDSFGGLMIFENAASHSNVDDASFVDGFVRKNGNQQFRFPIGDNQQYRYAAISNPITATDAFSGKYFWQNSNPLYPHSNRDNLITLIDNAEYWIIEKTQGNSNIFLTLTWDVDTTPTAIYATPIDEIHIVRWDVAQGKWIDEGGVADSVTKEVSTVINPLTQYGVFTLARVKTIVPCSGNSLIVHNLISSSYTDSKNDYFSIEGIENCPNNKVAIFNRWGVKVFETENYNSNGNIFDGYSQARATLNNSERLPDGTYFYFVEVTDEQSGSTNKFSGYLFLN